MILDPFSLLFKLVNRVIMKLSYILFLDHYFVFCIFFLP